MVIDLVVVNYQRYDLTAKFIDSYVKYQPRNQSRLLMVDNDTQAGQLYGLDLSSVEVFPFKENLGYAKACNFGASMSDSKYIGLFNNDVEFVNDTCIDQCIEFMDSNPDVGIVGPYQYSTVDGRNRITHAGILGTAFKPEHRGWLKNDRGEFRFNDEVTMVMGSAMIVRREFWNKVMADPVFREMFPRAMGAMPETPLYYEDTGLCYAAQKFGYKVYYVGESGCELIHQWHQTINGNRSADARLKESKEIFKTLMEKWEINV